MKHWKRDTRPAIEPATDITDLLKISTEIYNDAKDQQKAKEKAIAEEKKKAADAKAAAEMAKKVQYPLLSKLVGSNRIVTLDDDKVMALVTGLLSEISHLFKKEGRDMICKGLNDAEVALLPIPACANVKSLEEVVVRRRRPLDPDRRHQLLVSDRRHRPSVLECWSLVLFCLSACRIEE